MNTSDESTKAAADSGRPLINDLVLLARYAVWSAARWARPYVGGRRGWLILGIVVVGTGAALSWDWLVAIGAAPLLLALAPCAAMCALGLCVNRGGGESCSGGKPDSQANGEHGAGSDLPPPDNR